MTTEGIFDFKTPVKKKEDPQAFLKPVEQAPVQNVLPDKFFIIKPWKHQLDAINRAIKMYNYAFFFEVGAGKTLATINTLRFRYFQENRVMKTLILCPVVVCENWRREFLKNSKVDKSKLIILKGSGKKRVETILDSTKEDTGKIFITNYEALQMDPLFEAIRAWGPEVIVADEVQRLKSPKAVRTKKAIKLGDMAKHRYILSGTPILNNPMDIWSQYRFLDKGASFDKNFVAFRAKYFIDKNAGMPKQKYFPDWKPRPGIAEEFSQKIYALASRALKKDCLDLPPLVKTQVFAEMSEDQMRMYATMKKAFVAYLEDRACVAQIALTKSLRLQQIVSGYFMDDEGKEHIYNDNPRVEVLRELLKDITPANKVIVWACFRENYKMIEKVLEEEKIPYRVLVGGMKDKDRQTAIDDFEKQEDVRVIVGNQGAGGVGINLIAANTMIYYSRDYSLEKDMQSEARNYRGGSEIHDKVTRIDIVTPGTIDDAILDALYSKKNMAEEILTWKNKI